MKQRRQRKKEGDTHGKEIYAAFFHERNYEPQSLQAFEREAVQAAQAGATHMYVMDVPKRFEEWSAHPGDPYPNWGMLQTCLFKLVVPRALEPYLDADYARRNLELVRRRSEIVKNTACRRLWSSSTRSICPNRRIWTTPPGAARDATIRAAPATCISPPVLTMKRCAGCIMKPCSACAPRWTSAFPDHHQRQRRGRVLVHGLVQRSQRARGLPQGEHGGPDCWFPAGPVRRRSLPGA